MIFTTQWQLRFCVYLMSAVGLARGSHRQHHDLWTSGNNHKVKKLHFEFGRVDAPRTLLEDGIDIERYILSNR
jgi:hypothetical protein